MPTVGHIGTVHVLREENHIYFTSRNNLDLKFFGTLLVTRKISGDEKNASPL
jgi:hypothetical protein